MPLSTRTIGIIIALLISGSFIALGYFLSSPLSPQFANAGSTDELLKAYAEKDTDADGLPDWQESLYGTDPTNAHSTSASVTDAEAVANGTVKLRFESEGIPEPEVLTEEDFDGQPAPAPGSLTDEFAKEFFEKYMQGVQGEAGITTDNLEAFVTQKFAIYQSEIPTYAKKDIVVSGSGSAALSLYARAMADVLRTYAKAGEKDELTYLEEAIIQNDARALKELGNIAAGYAATTKAAARVSVPTELADAHLALLNSFSHVGASIENMAAYETDPIRTLLGIEGYSGATDDLVKALVSIGKVYANSGTTVTTEDSGYYFFSLTEQAASVPDATTP